MKNVNQKSTLVLPNRGLKFEASSEVTPNDIDDYKRIRLAEGKQPATVNRDLGCTKTLIFLAKKRKRFFGENPISEVGLLPVNNQKERILTIEEDLLLANAEEPLKSFIQIALNKALRLNSIGTLTSKCIDFNTNTITIESIYSKNKKAHVIPMSTDVRKLLLETKLRCGSSEYVFPEYIKLTRSAIGMRFRLLCKKLAATRMVESDVSIDKVEQDSRTC